MPFRPGSAGLRTEVRLAPVSYTHLDVSKRQTYPWPTLAIAVAAYLVVLLLGVFRKRPVQAQTPADEPVDLP